MEETPAGKLTRARFALGGPCAGYDVAAVAGDRVSPVEGRRFRRALAHVAARLITSAAAGVAAEVRS